jgi:hypothetical protein
MPLLVCSLTAFHVGSLVLARLDEIQNLLELLLVDLSQQQLPGFGTMLDPNAEFK